jgi:hypothetical protein
MNEIPKTCCEARTVTDRKINVKEAVQDIEAGMSESALMEKYGLTTRQLKALFIKLGDIGALQPRFPRASDRTIVDSPRAPDTNAQGAGKERRKVKAAHALVVGLFLSTLCLLLPVPLIMRLAALTSALGLALAVAVTLTGLPARTKSGIAVGLIGAASVACAALLWFGAPARPDLLKSPKACFILGDAVGMAGFHNAPAGEFSAGRSGNMARSLSAVRAMAFNPRLDMSVRETLRYLGGSSDGETRSAREAKIRRSARLIGISIERNHGPKAEIAFRLGYDLATLCRELADSPNFFGRPTMMIRMRTESILGNAIRLGLEIGPVEEILEEVSSKSGIEKTKAPILIKKTQAYSRSIRSRL